MKRSSLRPAAVMLVLGAAVLLGFGAGREQIRKLPGLDTLGQPDFKGTLQVNEQPSWFEVGNDVAGAIQLRVSNWGNRSAKSFSVKLVLSTSPLGSVSFPYSPAPGSTVIGEAAVTTALAPLASTQVTFSQVRIPDSLSYGAYYFTAVIDPDDQHKEKNESNNTAEAQGWVKAMVEDSWMTAAGSRPYWYFRGKGFGAWKAGLTAQAGSYSVPMTADGWSPTMIKIFAGGIIPPGSETYSIQILDAGRPVCRTQSEVWGTVITAMNPPSGPAGADVGIMCVNNGGAQGTRKVCLTHGAQCLGEAVVTAWANGLIKVRIPALPAGSYLPIIFEGPKGVSFLAGQVSFTIQ